MVEPWAIAKQMHLATVDLGAQFDSRHHVDAYAAPGRTRLLNTVQRVMVGQRHSSQPGGSGVQHQTGRGVGAVGDIGVGVQVDVHSAHPARR